MGRQKLGAGASGCHVTDPNPKMKTWGAPQSGVRLRLKPGRARLSGQRSGRGSLKMTSGCG